MSSSDPDADQYELPIKRTDGDTLEERLTANAYHNILPARYLRKDTDGNLIEDQEDLFERVAKNIALAEAVYEARQHGETVSVSPDQLKPDHPRRDELAADVFGAGTTVEDDVETELTEENVSNFAYETVVPALDEEIQSHVAEVATAFQTLMEDLSFIPNSPTLMNAGDELQQLSACFVDSPEDDLTDIHQTAKEAAEVFQCLTADTSVHIAGGGLTRIENVEPGDEIRQRDPGNDGYRIETVAETHVYEEAPVRRVTTNAGVELTGTPNHELLVDGEWTRIDEIEAGQTLSIRLDWLPERAPAPSLETVSTGGQWDNTRSVSNDEISDLHAAGLSDYEIADQLDCSASTVQRRRASELDLAPNGSGGRPAGSVSFDTDHFDELYAAGHTDGEMAADLGVSAAAVGQYRNTQSLAPNGTPVKSVTQPSELTPPLAELLGMWIGDGSMHEDGIRLHLRRERNLDHANRLCRELFDTSLDWRFNEGCYDAVLHSHEVKRFWQANFGDAKTAAPAARVPELVTQSDRETVTAFLRGLFSTDGSLLKDTYPRLWTASKDLAAGVQQLLLGLGIPAVQWSLDDEDRDYYNVGPTGKRALTRFADAIGFTDEREDAMHEGLANTEVGETTFGTVRDGTTWDIPVTAVTDAGTDTVYDVTVAGDHEYLADSVVSHNSGGGMGYAFWRLRPFGDSVGSTGGIASGPVTFMETYDQMCETIAQGGARRGAQMGVMRVSHPDVIEFIHSKNKDVSLAHTLRLNDPDDYTYTTFAEALEEARDLIDEDGRVPEHLRNAVEGHLSNFNISVGVTDDFMDALEAGEAYTFTNPRTGEPHIATEETKEMYSRYGLGDHVEVGEEFSIDAQIIWDRIIDGAHENGEPGVIYLERVNKQHSFDVEEHPEHTILATNPCGEQPLEEYEACNLGHINLSTIAAEDAPDWRVWSERHGEGDLEADVEAFLEEAIDFEDFDRRIELGTRFLENVVTMSDFPVEEITETVARMRKVGLGIMGLAQLYVQLGVRYGSEAGNEIARQLMVHINHGSKWASHELAEERGSFDDWEDSKYADPTAYREWFEHHTGLNADKWAEGFPIRNHNTTTIAPTGTTSMVGNTTGGCEPIYNVAYYKNVSDDVQGDEMLVEFDDYFLRTLEANDIDVDAVKKEAERQMAENEFDGVEGLETVPDAIGELFVITSDLSGKEHAAVQCACQEGVDSAISKTCNFPNDATVEDMEEVYRYIYENGGKGVTVYRDGTRSKQVLTTRAENTDFANMDEDEAAEAILEEIEATFDGLAGFFDHETVEAAMAEASLDALGTEAESESSVRPRPDTLHGVSQRIETGYGKLYVTINEDPETGEPFELFANIGHSGGYTNSFTEALAKVISTALRSGVDPEEIVDELRGTRSPKVAWDKGEQINSIPDAIGTALGRYIEGDLDRNVPRQQTLSETADAADGDAVRDTHEPDMAPETDGGGTTVDAEAGGTDGDQVETDTQSLIDAGESPECPDCGSMDLHYSEGCKTCQSCGWSEC